MWITRKEVTVIPQTSEGQKVADEYESRLRSQGCFDGRKEDTVRITITALYSFSVKDGEADDETGSDYDIKRYSD